MRQCRIRIQQLLFENTARAMQGVTREIMLKHIRHCYRADAKYGLGVAKSLGISEKEFLE